MNHNWERWINSSIADAIKTTCDSNGIHLYVEGSPRDTLDLQDWIELRVNGPDWIGCSQDNWIARVEVNIFILSKLNQADNFRLLKNIGILRTRLSQSLPVFKLGTSVDDDQSFITCLVLRDKGRESLKVSQLGQINGDTPLIRATIDVMFSGDFVG